jgi:hypothetical protein
MIPKTPSKSLNVIQKYVVKIMNRRLNVNTVDISMKKTWLLSKNRWTRGRLREWKKILKS